MIIFLMRTGWYVSIDVGAKPEIILMFCPHLVSWWLPLHSLFMFFNQVIRQMLDFESHLNQAPSLIYNVLIDATLTAAIRFNIIIWALFLNSHSCEMTGKLGRGTQQSPNSVLDERIHSNSSVPAMNVKYSWVTLRQIAPAGSHAKDFL